MVWSLLAIVGLWYQQPASDSIEGWERESLPIGCGWFGANVFGGVTNERIQVTHNAVLSDEGRYGISLVNGLEIRLSFPHAHWSGYRRGLDLETACSWVRYNVEGVNYSREAFASYQDRVLAMRLTADKPGALDFSICCEAPFLHEKRTAIVCVTNDMISVDQKLMAFDIDFASRLKVAAPGAAVFAADGGIMVRGATEAFVYFSCDANYEISSERFRTHKAVVGMDVRPRVEDLVMSAAQKGYVALRRDHLSDYRALFDRVAISLDAGSADADLPTDVLLAHVAKGGESRFLEELYCQYGRYLLIASSRKGGLPANLQGIWTAHRRSPWGSGYWHNINVQMNYWLAFNGNLVECFEPYAAFNDAFRPVTHNRALSWLKQNGAPDALATPASDDLWSVGTSAFPYSVSGRPGTHSGPGTGGLTTKLFWDWWDFTRDAEVLKRAYPVLHGMADFLVRCVIPTNGLYLSKFSASPEQFATFDGKWDKKKGRPPYYVTIGCAFDQQMIWENNRDFLEMHRLLGFPEDWTSMTARRQLCCYDPVQVGDSGQIKEFREEHFYGEIGEKHHRHISQLVGLMPGTIINKTHPEWMEAARKTLNFRGDKSTGWALAHRLNAWARLGDGDHALKLLQTLLSERTNLNLWDMHPPFQIDGNFGAASGMIEMLLQSHSGYIDLLPALPKSWSTRGSFRGLCARGAFVVDCDWAEGRPTRVVVRSYRHQNPDVRFAGRQWKDFTLIEIDNSKHQENKEDKTCR